MPLKRLPMWIQISAFILALNAGMINVLGVLHLAHQTISHMTGNVTMLAVHTWAHDYQQIMFILSVIFSFVLGSFLSGFIIRDAKLRLGRRYGSVLSCEALLLFITAWLIPNHPHALLLASMAAGMQNALASTYNGTIIRTTHLSGVLTDIGLSLGYLAQGLYVDPRKITLHVLIFGGFILGGLLGILMQSLLMPHAFLAPACLTALLSAAYWLYYFKVTHPNR